MALMVIVDKLIKSIDNEEHVIGVLLDFSKTFDTIDHDTRQKDNLYIPIVRSERGKNIIA